VVQTGDTYVFHPDTPKETLLKNWVADSMDTFVAVDDQGWKISGIRNMLPGVQN
jgi:hypothetical protein